VSLVLALVYVNALGAIAIPIGPVPLPTTFAVLLTGALLGSRLGAAALIAYLWKGNWFAILAGDSAGWRTFWADWRTSYHSQLTAFITGALPTRVGTSVSHGRCGNVW